MIELRWLERRIPVPPEYNVGVPPQYPTERVLQYRYYKTFEVFPGGTFNHHIADWATGWTEWQDVPIVKQGD